METKQDYSYGIIPLRKEVGEWRVFLINQISRRGETYWTFTKGHAEGEETAKETALRELYEEAGITPERVDWDKVFQQTYNFVHDGIKIEKRVDYYLGFVDSPEFIIQAQEVKEAGWFTFCEARERLTFDLAKKALDEVEIYLN